MTAEGKDELGGLPRWIEAAAALVGLVAVSPLLVLCAMGVRFSSPGPVLFRQARAGRDGQPFTLLKFRTMRKGERGAQVTAAGDSRITPFGRLLRRLKLDELPELWNVVRGDMSLVGPRPEVPQLVDLQDPLCAGVLRARPGITDPVTLRLRNEEELLAGAQDPETFYREVLQPVKMRGYVEYLRRRTAWTDLVVLLETLLAVVWPAVAAPPRREDLALDPVDLFRLRRWRVRRAL